jgi:hypothetical protein
VFVVPDQLPTITIKVRTIGGTIFEVAISNATTVGQLKLAIQHLKGIPSYQQRIIFGGQQMIDGEFLRLKEKPAH